ncbi:MAG: hypothetical protein PWP46_1051 [Fusobacteriaceae bacterium]|jgi:hypothetical protein|nr:hypothetical protein [Fusobacteriaceae bacterium]
MKKIIYIILLLNIIACSKSIQTNVQLLPKININTVGQDRDRKIENLNQSIDVYEEKGVRFYYSNGETFQNFDGYTFYVAPYIVEELSFLNRITLRLFVQSITNQKNMFKTITFFDENNNKVSFIFNEIVRKRENDDFLIKESGDIVISLNDFKVMEQFIDSENIYISFHGEKKYTFRMNNELEKSFKNILRKYKLMII